MSPHTKLPHARLEGCSFWFSPYFCRFNSQTRVGKQILPQNLKSCGPRCIWRELNGSVGFSIKQVFVSLWLCMRLCISLIFSPVLQLRGITIVTLASLLCVGSVSHFSLFYFNSVFFIKIALRKLTVPSSVLTWGVFSADVYTRYFAKDMLFPMQINTNTLTKFSKKNPFFLNWVQGSFYHATNTTILPLRPFNIFSEWCLFFKFHLYLDFGNSKKAVWTAGHTFCIPNFKKSNIQNLKTYGPHNGIVLNETSCRCVE